MQFAREQRKRGDQFRIAKDFVYLKYVDFKVCWLLGQISLCSINMSFRGGKLTVANQHIRNSYLRFSDKESRRNHDAGPWGSVDVGKAAFNWRRRVDLKGVKVSNLSWSRFGCTEGTIDDSGAEKMIFSTLPKARKDHKVKTRGMVISLIVM